MIPDCTIHGSCSQVLGPGRRPHTRVPRSSPKERSGDTGRHFSSSILAQPPLSRTPRSSRRNDRVAQGGKQDVAILLSFTLLDLCVSLNASPHVGDGEGPPHRLPPQHPERSHGRPMASHYWDSTRHPDRPTPKRGPAHGRPFRAMCWGGGGRGGQQQKNSTYANP